MKLTLLFITSSSDRRVISFEEWLAQDYEPGEIVKERQSEKAQAIEVELDDL